MNGGPGIQPVSVEDAIRQRLAELEPESISLDDDSAQHAGHEGAKSGGGHYRLTLVSPKFTGQSLQARHRMVYRALAPLMTKDIHALAINAYAPDEI